MTVGTGDPEVDMPRVILVRLLPMASVTALEYSLRGVEFYVRIDDAGMRIVAGNAVNGEVFRIEELVELLIMFRKTI
jgi:hypothetical protein